MRLTPKHVGMEISYGDMHRWVVLRKLKTCKRCVNAPHLVVHGGHYAEFAADNTCWRVRKPQSKRRKM